MARIFYCGGLAGRVGTLRAVVPAARLSGLLSNAESRFIGRAFPRLRLTDPECTVIEVLPEEEWERIKAGFYLVATGPLEIEDRVAKTLEALPRGGEA